MAIRSRMVSYFQSVGDVLLNIRGDVGSFPGAGGLFQYIVDIFTRSWRGNQLAGREQGLRDR